MKKSLLSLLFMSLLASVAMTQDHIITLEGIAFSPNDLTIQVGETVLFDNVGGSHNVDGNDPMNPESFGNSVAPAPWQYTYTFNTPGVYNYHCDPHEGFGMTGVITVQAAMAGEVIITEINYNNPGSDSYEFVELYNNGDEAVEMEGWTLANAIEFTFPALTLGVGEYVIVANDAAAFEAAFGILPLEFSGALNNTGETIELLDASGTLTDEVAYSEAAPWPSEADGGGPTLVLCDYDSDNNNGENWAAATTPTGFEVNGIQILANPGADSNCPTGPVVGLLNNGFTVLESAGSVFVTVAMSNGDANTTTVDLEMNMASTTTNGQDFSLALPFTVTFDAGVANDTQTVTINLIDDMDIEPSETLILDLANPTNSATISPNANQYTLTILDDDTPLTNAMVITGVFDTQPAGAGAKGVELQALEDIPDISIYGVGSANNGTGSAGVETGLPVMSVSAGDCIYVTDDEMAFIEFFGFEPTVEGDAANINGDDAIELFENNIPIDVFGDVTVDGTGEPWEYLDGWAYRKSGTGPDGTVFELDNWNFSGVGALVGAMSNNEADPPFPTCSYSEVAPTTAVANDDNVIVPFNTTQVINVLGNDVTPNALTSMSIISAPTNGGATVNGLDNITYEPNADFCGSDAFTYEICDAAGCDVAVVVINVECPPAYPEYDIATVTSVDAEGIPDSIGVSCQIQGIVHGIDFQGGDAIQFAVIDETGGISLFSGNDFGYTVTEGDEVIVQGEISEFNCLTQISPDTLWSVSSGNDLFDANLTTFVDEEFESELVLLTNVQLVDPSQWLGDGNSFNVEITNGTFTNTIRIDNDTEMASEPWPVGTAFFEVTGLGGQFDANEPCDVGYQLFPRYWADFGFSDNTIDRSLAEKISIYPNPVSERLFIEVKDVQVERATVSNMFGQVMLEVNNPSNSINVQELSSGVYTVTFQVGNSAWAAKFVKK